MTALAPPPTRATTNLTLKWGLVPVRLSLFTAVEDTTPLKRSMYHTSGAKIIMPKVNSATGEPAASDEIQFMAEVDGKLVEVTDEEMAQVTSDFDVDRDQVEITFVPLSTIGDRYLVDKWYQARAGKTVSGTKKVADPHAEKAFALLLQSMAKKKVACLFRASLKGPARYAALTPDGKVHFLYYDGEVRESLEFPDVVISKDEAQQGLALIDSIGISDDLDLVDERGETLLAYVQKKLVDGKGIEPRDVDGQPVQAPLDLAAALAASIEAAPKTKAKATKAKPAAKAA